MCDACRRPDPEAATRQLVKERFHGRRCSHGAQHGAARLVPHGCHPGGDEKQKGPDPRGVRASGKRCAQGVATRSPLPDWRSDPHGWRSQAAARRPCRRHAQTIHGPLGGSCFLRWGEPFSRWVLGVEWIASSRQGADYKESSQTMSSACTIAARNVAKRTQQ
jgi:hypothetical protein